MRHRLYRMWAGDALAVAVVTLIGFASHGELSGGFLWRMGVFFLAILVSWTLIGLGTGVFSDEAVSGRLSLRVPLTTVLAAPLAALIRSLVLWVPVVPIFVLVITVVSTVGMTCWRAMWSVLSRRAAAGTGTPPPTQPRTPSRS